jgi:hypothetical protein
MIPERDASPSAKQQAVPSVGQPFNPYKRFPGAQIPEAICRYKGLSPGAKLAYGRLARFAGEDGECWPAVETVGREVGVGKTQARTYLHELRDKHFIAIEPRLGTSDVFTFLWHEAFAGEIGQKRKCPPLRKTVGPPHRKAGGVAIRKTEGHPLRKTGDEESQWKENHHQVSQIKENQNPSTAESKPKTLSRNHSSDDEQVETVVYQSPWEEIRAGYRQANNNLEMSAHDERWVKEQCELRGVEIATLVELLRQNPLCGFKSPMAGLKWLVKNSEAKARSTAEAEFAAHAVLPGLLSVELPRCIRCGNSGWVLERREGERPLATNQHCDCTMGRDVEAVERRRVTSAATAAMSSLPTETEKHHDQIA